MLSILNSIFYIRMDFLFKFNKSTELAFSWLTIFNVNHSRIALPNTDDALHVRGGSHQSRQCDTYFIDRRHHTWHHAIYIISINRTHFKHGRRF